MGVLRRTGAYKFAAFVGAMFLFIAAHATAASIQLQEQKIKAGLLYNFVKYTAWPESAFQKPDAPFQICLLGGDTFQGALNPLQGRTAQMRSINIRKIMRPESLEDCHVAFINRSQKNNISSILSATKGRPVLLLSDIDGFSKSDGMVEFSSPSKERIHLYINKSVIEESGLRVGDQLLKLAELR